MGNGSVMDRAPQAIQPASRLDFRGVYRTRCGAAVRILFWHGGCWVGKKLEIGALLGVTNLTWDANGKATDSGLDLMERVSGYPAMELKFGLLVGGTARPKVGTRSRISNGTQRI